LRFHAKVMLGHVTRFAPSPTGLLHLGHAHAALFARAAGVRCLLRIEDIDAGRCRAEFAAALEEDLAWLGLAFDGATRVQSAHRADYAAALATLDRRGLLYPCFCTRADIAESLAAAHAPQGAPYPGTCRHRSAAERAERLAAGQKHGWRLDMARALVETGKLTATDLARGAIFCAPTEDVVLARKDIPLSYHLCATHDDAIQGVALVTRGEDLLDAVPVQRVLQALMGWPEPLYHHHPLLYGADGRRLAKRDGAPTLRGLRAAGHSPAAVRAMAGFA
jgi:glutamyl-Q tRNA(Asp) synthetase